MERFLQLPWEEAAYDTEHHQFQLHNREGQRVPEQWQHGPSPVRHVGTKTCVFHVVYLNVETESIRTS